MHFYPFNPSKYLLSTAHWSEDRNAVECEAGLLRDLAYRRLLDLYYGDEAPIPSKTRLVAISIRMLKHEEIVASVLKEKFTLIDGFWHQEVADDEVQKYQRRAEASRENGKKGGRPKLDQTKKNPAGSKQDAGRKQLRTRTIKDTPLPPEGVEVFEKFWNAYPKKADKPAAVKAFAKAMGWHPKDAKPRATLDEIMAGLAVHLTCRQWTKEGGEFVPNPATWLNADGWNDRPLQPDAHEDPAACWWLTRAGLLAKAVEIGAPGPDDETPQAFIRFKAGLWVAAGDGPWWDHNDTAYPLAVRIRNGEEGT